MLGAFENLLIVVAFRSALYFDAYLSTFFNVFYLISSILDFSISSSRAHLSRFAFCCEAF